MSALQLLTELRALGVGVSASDGKLRFTAGAGVLTPELKARLAEHKQDLLSLLDTSASVGISAADRSQPLPMSFAQRRLWFMHALAPESPAYNMSAPYRVRGALDVDAFCRAVELLVERHETLRTTFAMEQDGSLVQRIAPPGPFPVTRLEADGDSVEARTKWASDTILERAKEPFDLEKGPVFRVTVVRIGEHDHAISFTIHHIVSDGWSMGLLTRDLSACYAAALSGSSPDLPPLEFQYADFAKWQHDRSADADADPGLAYWRKALADPPLVNLPTDHQRPPTQTSNGDSVIIPLDDDLVRMVNGYSSTSGATRFMIMLAAYQAQLSHVAGQHDIVCGSAVAGRDHSGVENLIGFFIGNVVLRARIENGTSFDALVSQVRETALSAFEHQDVPFERIVDELGVARDPSRNPIFQTTFALQNTPSDTDPSIGGLAMEPLVRGASVARFDLEIHAIERGEGLSLAVVYNTDLFERATAQRIAEQYARLLRWCLEDPSRSVRDADLLSAEERELVTGTWATAPRDYPRDASIQSLFEAQVEMSPDAIAVIDTDRNYTYRELNERANRLAHRLIKMGVKAEEPIGLMCTLSIDQVVAALAILKAGGAYLPLDSSYPQSRLQYMIDDSKPRLVVVDSENAEHLPSVDRVTTLRIEAPDLAEESDENPSEDVSGRSLAYLMYTSGSTGQPKGTEIVHRGVTRLVLNTNYLDLSQSSIVARLANIAFDASTFEMWGPLLNGAAMCIIDRETLLDIDSFVDRIQTNSVSHMFLTTALFNNTVQERPAAFASLERLMVGGEALDPRSIDIAMLHGRPRHLFNIYGPTESTTFALCHEIKPRSARERARAASIPIGKPITNTRAYVLDERLSPVPIGVHGELCLAGDGLARGYLNKDDLTRERFVRADAVGEETVYRTGDIVRWRNDGVIEFMGRRDHQIKYRGFRIELNEITLAMDMLEEVRESITVCIGQNNDKKIVAYLTLQDGHTLTPSDVRLRLKDSIPEYMIPSAIVILDDMPINANGKIDQGALPDPSTSAAETAVELSSDDEPRNQTQATLATIWAELLRVPKVGIHANFFELGGDSIVGIQVLARAKEHGLSFSPSDLFKNQTIAELSLLARSTSAASELPPLTGLVPLTAIQKWFFSLDLTDDHHFNQAFLLTVPEHVTDEELRDAAMELLMRHDALRLRFVESDGQWMQEVVESPDLAFYTHDLSALDDESYRDGIESVCSVSQRSFAYRSGNVVRFDVMDLGPSRGRRLFIAAHHLVIDAVSWRVIIEDLKRLVAGQPAPPRSLPFTHWAQREEERASSAEILGELSEWIQLTADAPEAPTPDRVDKEDLLSESVRIPVILDEAATDRLLREAPGRFDARIDELLLAAFARAWNQWAGQPRVLVDLETHGRDRSSDESDITRTVGWFTSIYPVCLDGGAPDVPSTIHATRLKMASVPASGEGFLILREQRENQATRVLRDLPTPPVSFNYLGRFDQTFEAGGDFAPSAEPTGPLQSPRQRRGHLIDVAGSTVGGKLRMSVTAGTNRYNESSITSLADLYKQALLDIVSAIDEAPTVTASDASDFGWSEDDLDDILSELND